jgi:clan AA aspartic protease (TIGR02281 family)
MKLRYDTKRNPIMTGVLIFLCIPALLYLFMKVDLTNVVFGKIGAQEPPMKTMAQAQYAEVIAIAKQRKSEKQSDTNGPDKQIAVPMQKEVEQRFTLAPQNEPGSVYQYTDSSGMIVMVDDLEKVPAKYRAKMKTSSSMYGQPRTAVKVQNNQIWVPVTLAHKGRTVTSLLLLDTGATNTSISPALARRLGVQTTETTGGKVKLADGSVVQAAYVVVDHVTVGPKAKRYLNVQIIPRSGDEETGLLGMNFLGDFPHIIEARAGIIRWQ